MEVEQMSFLQKYRKLAHPADYYLPNSWNGVSGNYVNPDSRIMSEELAKLLFCRMQDADLDGAPLTERSWERALHKFGKGAGLDLEIQDSPVSKDADLRMHCGSTGEWLKLALKSESRKNIDPMNVRLTKLIQSSWVVGTGKKGVLTYEDVRDNATEWMKITAKRISDHYQHMLVLRYFSAQRRYQLLEIPLSLLLRIGELRSENFGTKKTAHVKNSSNRVVMAVGLDTRGGKIVLSRVPVSLCFLHATWQLPHKEKDCPEFSLAV